MANASVRGSPERLPAFVGRSVFEGESISAEEEGKLGVRIGSVALALSGNSSATSHRMSGGTHVDMESGWSYFSSRATSSLQVHAFDALLRPAKNQPTQARVRIYTRQALQFLPFAAICCSRIETSHESYRKAKPVRSTWTRKAQRRSRRDRAW